MAQREINHYLNNLDRCLHYLDKPNIRRTSDGKIRQYSLCRRICLFVSKIFVRLARVWNYVFGDHYGYNELKARKIVIYYLNRVPLDQRTKEKSKQILAIYDRLNLLREGSGTYADKIDAAKIAELRTGSIKKSESAAPIKPKKTRPPKPKSDHDKYLISQEPAETVPTEPDEAAVAHHLLQLGTHRDISPRTLMHLHGNRFGKNSDLEGLSNDTSPEALGYLHHYLTARQASAPHPAIALFLTRLSGLMEIDRQTTVADFTNTARSKIQAAFNANESVLIPGGWVGTPTGHALYYEIIPESATHAKMRVINSGAGLNHHTSDLAGNKTKYQPYTEWRGISKEALLGDNFLTAIAEMRLHATIPNENSNTSYGEKDVYKALKQMLQPQSTDEGEAATLLVSPQSSGICKMKGLFFVLRTYLEQHGPEGKAIYKRFKTDIRIQSLVDRIFNPAPVKELSEVGHWRLIHKSVQKTCRSIDRLFAKKMVTQAYVDEAVEALRPVTEWVEKNRKVLHKPPEFSDFQFKQLSSPHVSFNDPDSTLDDQAAKKAAGAALQANGFITETFKALVPSSGQDVGKALAQVKSDAESAWKKGADDPLYSGLLYFIDHLSTEEKFWREAAADPEQAKKLIVDLGEIAHLFFKTCFTVSQSDIIVPERVNALIRIQNIITILTRFTNHKIRFQNYAFDGFLCSVNNYVHTDQAFDQEAEKAKAASADYILGTDSTSLFDQVSRTFSNNQKDSFHKFATQAAPSLLKDIAQADPAFSRLPTYAQEARLYTSELLPDWLKSIRNTGIYCSWLMGTGVGKPASIDRTSHFNLKFNVKDHNNHRFSILEITLTGVNYHDFASQLDLARFALIHGRLSENLSKLIDSSKAEKKIIGDKKAIKESGFSEEEYQAIKRIFSDPETQCAEALDYFTTHPDKLKNKDYQIIFRRAVFAPGIAQKALKKAGLAQVLRRFMDHHLELWMAANEIQGCIFLLQCQRFLRTYDTAFPDALPKLKQLLLRAALEPEEKSVIYAELIANLAHRESEDLQPEDIAHLIAGIAYLKDNPVPNKWQEMLTQNDVNRAPNLHANAIRDYLCPDGVPDQNHLNEILKTLNPALGAQTWIQQPGQSTGTNFASTDGNYRLWALDGIFIDSANPGTILPVEIRHHPHFRRLFPGIETARRISKDVFSFQDQNHCETRISYIAETGSLRIDQQIAGAWAFFIPPETFIHEEEDKATGEKKVISSLSSRYLAQNCSHWRNYSDPSRILLRNFSTGRVDYEALVKEQTVWLRNVWINGIATIAPKEYQITEVRECRHGWRLGTPSNLCEAFEDPAYIHEWYNAQNQVQKVELPRYSLTFSRENDGACEQFPGYTIANNQTVAQLGTYSHFLVLQNEEGKKKVLLPCHDFSPSNKKEIFEARFDINEELEKGNFSPQRFFAYDFNEDRLSSRSLEANLYLVQALLAVQEYEAAAYYLKQHGNKISMYSARETQMLIQISNQKAATGDCDANACAIRAYAGYLLLKNDANYHQRHLRAFGIIKKNCQEYLDLYRNATVLKLKAHEEILLLTTILGEIKHFDPLLYLRLRELDPAAARDLTLPENTQSTDEEDEMSLRDLVADFDFDTDHPLSIRKPAINDHLITRLAAPLKKNFWGFYQLAVEGTAKEKLWLEQALHFVEIAKNKEERGLARVFKTILNNAGAFTAIPTTEGIEKLSKWRNEMIETLQQAAIPSTPSPTTPAQPSNSTPANFQMMPAEPELAPLNAIPITLVPPSDDWASIAATFFDARPRTLEANSKEFAAWLKERAEHSRNNELQNQAYRDLQSDWEELNKQTPSSSYTLKTGVNLDAIAKQLGNGKKEAQEKLTKQEEEIVKLANVFSTSNRNRDQLLRWGGQRPPLTLEEVLINYARQQQGADALHRGNPALEDAEIKILFEKVGDYLLGATHEQQRMRALETLGKLQKLQSSTPRDPAAEQDLLEQLATDLSAQHRHDPASSTAAVAAPYLVFEYFAKILLRPEQVSKIEEFIQSGDQNLMMEILMGFGKSKVLLVLLAFMLAKKDVLALLVIPPSLFENISADTQCMLQDAFGQSLRSFNFDRGTTFTVPSLRNILRDLVTIQEQGDCLVMTSKSLMCLMLKFIEAVDVHFKDYENQLENDPDTVIEWPEHLRLMQQILNRFNDSRAVVDEADSVFRMLRKVCFSLNKRHGVKAYETRVIAEIYKLLYSNDFRSLGRLESDSAPDPSAPAVTMEIYKKRIQKPLAEAFIKMLSTLTVDSAEHDKALADFIPSLNAQENHQKLMYYLCRDKAHRAEGQAFYDAQTKEVKEILALAGQMISQFLPHTLTQIDNEGYGIDPESRSSTAVPFLATNVPTKGSQYANPHITQMYTFQSVNKNGIRRDTLIHEIERIQSNAMVELREGGGKVSLEQTTAWELFKLLKGDVDIPLFNFKPRQIDALLKAINANIDTKIQFVEKIIIPQLEQYEENSNCNPINLSSFLPCLQGFTGTFWTARSMHRKVTPQLTKGISAKTLEILFRNSRDAVVQLEEGTTREMLEKLGKTRYDVIIDAGGYFKRGTNFEVASEMARFYQKPVVFYNSRGEQAITDGVTETLLSQSSVSEMDRITFLDQDHTIGADVRYRRDAVGFVTIGRKKLHSKLSQSAWRLRGLDKLQRVVFGVSRDVEAIIKQETASSNVRFDQIAEFSISNQCQQQSRDNVQSFLAQLWDIPQQILLKVLRNPTLPPEQYHKGFKALKKLWIKPGIHTADELYGKIIYERPMGEIVKEERESCEEFLKQLFRDLPWLEQNAIHLDDQLKSTDELITKIEDALPAQALHPELDADQSTEVEQEVEQELEQELELETQNEIQGENRELEEYLQNSFDDIAKIDSDRIRKTYQCPRFALSQFLNRDAVLKKYSEAFSDLDVSLNVFAWPKTPGYSYEFNVSALQFFGQYRTPLHFVLVEGEKVTLINQNEASRFEARPGLYNLAFGFCNITDNPSDAVRKKIVKSKFLNGDSHYSQEEQALLKEWLEEAGPEEMRQLFVNHILSGFPQKTAAYQGSALQTTFRELAQS